MIKKNWLLLIGALMSCSASTDAEFSLYIKSVKAREGTQIDPVTQFKILEKFRYPEHDNRRSPFVEIFKKNRVSSLNIKNTDQSLTDFNLNSLRFVGVLKKDHLIWALISRPDGKISHVKPGDFMGRNNVKIIQIRKDALMIEETTQIAGSWHKKITTFTLSTFN